MSSEQTDALNPGVVVSAVLPYSCWLSSGFHAVRATDMVHSTDRINGSLMGAKCLERSQVVDSQCLKTNHQEKTVLINLT